MQCGNGILTAYVKISANFYQETVHRGAHDADILSKSLVASLLYNHDVSKYVSTEKICYRYGWDVKIL